MVNFLNVVPALVLATVVAAQTATNTGAPKILRPNGDVWWVAKSQNEIVWDCKDTSRSVFTVLVGNTDVKVQTAPIAIIAEQQNYQCSLTVTQDKANQAAGTGWFVQFANPINNTDVWSTSNTFEIKALGSAYPPQASDSPSGSNSSASGSASGSAASPSGKSAAVGLKSGLGAFGLAALGVAGLFA
ncbi:hypothetical protein CPB83DRAFT_818627 [Crepidotus variabilis]|uniref:Uncharacterized protein n=1 Tax=Crepidotus variabilis TaxID=179855 RepID=A0A9P6EAF8_9AGAR|nr:hypothetical protein CPB83DRAFT_818627 [Crepidotus variabilis]